MNASLSAKTLARIAVAVGTCVLVGVGCTTTSSPSADTRDSASLTPGSLLEIRHPRGDWRFLLNRDRYWQNESDRANFTDSTMWVSVPEPRLLDDVSFSLRSTSTIQTAGPPYLSFRVVKLGAGSVPFDMLLGRLRQAEEANNEPTLVETVAFNGTIFRVWHEDPNWQTVYLVASRGFVFYIRHFAGGGTPERDALRDIEAVVRTFEVR